MGHKQEDKKIDSVDQIRINGEKPKKLGKKIRIRDTGRHPDQLIREALEKQKKQEE